MSAFTGPLTVEEVKADSDLWRLKAPLPWEVGQIGSGVFVTAPVDFETDGASIPWPVSIVFPRWGKRYRRPAIIHDYLCRSINDGKPLPIAPRRSEADRIFLQAMRACGVSLPVRWAFYLAVSLYTALGSPAWLNPSLPVDPDAR
jgi:hypothetical protein